MTTPAQKAALRRVQADIDARRAARAEAEALAARPAPPPSLPDPGYASGSLADVRPAEGIAASQGTAAEIRRLEMQRAFEEEAKRRDSNENPLQAEQPQFVNISPTGELLPPSEEAEALAKQAEADLHSMGWEPK